VAQQRKRVIWRWLAAFIGIGLILIGLLVASLPVWFPWVARPILKPLGFRFEAYRATSYTTFEVRGVHGVIDGVEIEAGRVESWLPTSWVWNRLLGGDSTRLQTAVTDWEVRIRTPGEPRPEPKPDGVDTTFEVMDIVEGILAEVRFWAPQARVGAGAVDIDGTRIEVVEGLWREGQFTGTVRVPWFDGLTEVSADVSTRRRARLKADSEGLGLAAEVEVARHTDAWLTEGAIIWQGNQIPLTARFVEAGWMPGMAWLGSDQIRVSSGWLGLAGYGDLTGRIDWVWDGARFELAAGGAIRPDEERPSALRPPVTVELRGQGDLLSGTVDDLRVATPWLWLELADRAVLDWWGGRWVTEPALVDVGIDLQGMPGLRLDGVVEGRIGLSEGAGLWPELTFELDAGAMVAWGLELDGGRASGRLDWPRIEVRAVDLDLGAGSTFQAAATIDLASGWMESGQWQYEGDWVSRLLPTSLGYSRLQAGGVVNGAMRRLNHGGSIEARGVLVPGLNAGNLDLSWWGDALALRSIEARWEAGDSEVALGAALEVVGVEPVQVEASIEEVTLKQGDQTRYRLAEPVQLSWRKAAAVEAELASDETDWHLEMGMFRWTGASRVVAVEGELDWPRRGHVTGRVAGLVLADFRDLVPWPDWGVELQQLELIAGWNRGPLSVELSWNGTAVGPEDVPLALSGRVRGDGVGLLIEELTATTVLAPMLTVEGRIPVFLDPTGTNGWVQFDPERPINVRATTDAAGMIKLPIGVAGDAYLADPRIELELRGTVDQPEGHVRAELSGAEWRSRTGALVAPPLEQVRIDAVLGREQLRLDRFEVEVDGQPVRVTGIWPLGVGVWRALVQEGQFPRWQEASATVRIVDARVAPFARYLPEMLSSQGRLDLNLSVRPGARLDGDLVIVDAATRPIGPLTPIRDIEVRVRFDEHRAIIERFGGQIGGQPVEVTGHAELTEAGLPAFELAVTGRNVPLVRRPGFLLRSDLDVRLESAPDQPPRLSGEVRLRDGLFLQDIAALLTGRLERPPVRPPYFSVTNAPFADWRLDLRVVGDRFLRVRVPVFIGTISANGRLRGTMRAPVVTGDARIQSGRVLFPFGTLPVDQGYATLSEGDPRGPALAVVATGRNFRYYVRLEIEGSADDPLIQFSSTPPLTSEEILLMLTAGELPQREIVYSTEARAGRLATYLGREMVTRFVGDETAEERIIINTGENIAEDGRTTYSIEYRLHPRWSVVGEYDRFNALNAGLKWRVFTR
jgi:translocation and assembly module TamB